MNNGLKRYWFATEVGLGIGVTAFDIEDAKALIRSNKYAMKYKPKFEEYVQDIDIRALDQKHVIPNMGIVVHRGIWFPELNYNIA